LSLLKQRAFFKSRTQTLSLYLSVHPERIAPSRIRGMLFALLWVDNSIRRKDIQHHGVRYTSSATRFALALSRDIRSRDLKLVNANAPTLSKINSFNMPYNANNSIYISALA
jgi:hypothetical protein